MLQSLICVGSLVLLAASVAAGQSSRDNVDVHSQGIVAQTKNAGPAKIRELAMQFEQGRGVAKDLAAAFRLYERAASLGDTQAQVQTGYMLQSGRGTKADPQQAFRWFQRAASDGNARGQYDLAVAYFRGNGVGRDPAEAVVWLRKSAAQGDAKAQADLGGLYSTGEVVMKDCRLAKQWSEKAAKQGIALAEFNLASAELGECDGRANIPRAIPLLRRAASHGDVGAQYRLGQILAEGVLQPRDDAEALKWILAAASQGDAPAEFVAGMFYEFGRGVAAPDFSRAAQWYLASTSQDYPLAEVNLGRMIERGLVPGHGLSEALHWFTRAAQQGQPNAQVILAKHYEEGVGVPRDLALAAEWYGRAAPQLDAARACLSTLLASHPELLRTHSVIQMPSCSGPPRFGLLPGGETCSQSGERR